MFALLKKDYFTNRFIYLVSFLIVSLVIILLSMKSAEGSIVIGVLGTVLIPMLVNKYSSTEDMRKNYDLVMNSFPVKRSDVVLSRFIYYILVYAITAVVFSLLVIKFNKLEGFDLRVMLFVESILFLYYVMIIGITNAIYYTCPYEVVAKYSGVIMMIVIYVPMVLFGVITKFNPTIKDNFIEILSDDNPTYIKMTLIIFAIGVILYGLAIAVSMVGYNHKDLN